MSENVSSVPALSDIARQNLQISISRLNPLNFLDSMTAGRKGMIEYTIGTQSNEKPSYMKYNSYIPKHHNNAGIDTNFYDKNFDFIANNPVIYEFWKAMREGTYLIAENLIDSNLRLNKNSLLLFKKSFSEESINKEVGSIIKQGLGKMINLKQFVKNVISAKEPVYDNNEIVALPAQVKSFDTEVNSEFNILKTEVANIVGQKIEDNTRIVFDSLTKEKQQQIAELTGFPTIAEFQSSINKNVFSVRELKTYSQMKVMEQQTLNLPLMIKAFLELSAEHKARTNALNEVNIYREKSKSIKNQRNTASQRENEDRKNEITRQDFFYNRVVLNHSQKDHSGNASKVLIKMMKSYEFDNKVIGKHFYKNFTKEEKKIYTSVINRLAKIEEELEQETTDSKVLSLLQEKEDLEARIRILGKDYLLSALFDNVFNELTVRVGLGYNLLANIKNKLQGYTSLLSRDGEFWSRGNIYPVNHFVSLNKLRYINPSYKKEWDKSVLFIKQLNLIQDGTNELQRAESKIKKKTRFLSPMYGTEVVEYYNQVPGILAMAMDMEIKDVNGVPHPLFDGSTFTAYTNDNGNLKLKDEFRTPENIQTFEKMESEEMINWKISVENMTRSLHGDYSKTGVTQIKGNIYTKPLMVFKTWIPRYIATRYKYKQKNLITGNEETGYMISSLLNKKTSLTGGLMLAVTGAMGILSASPVLVGLPLVITLLFAGYAKYKMGKSNKDLPLMVDTTEPIAILAQASYVMKMLRPDKLFEVPINTIVGSELIKPVEFSADKNLTPQEARDVRLMARNMQNTIILMMIKFAIQGLLRFNEDDEPKGEVGSEQRKRYEAQQKKKEEMKVKYNFTENLMTGMLQETSLALEPTSLATTMGSKSGLQGPIDKLIKSSIALMRLSHEGDDEIQKGNRAGQSKSGNSLRKFFLPSLFRDLGHDTWRGGFETSMEKEWVNNETIDGIFDTDYKVDKTKAEKERAKIKLHYIEDWEEKNKKDIKELSEEDKAKIEKAAKREAKKESPNSDRDNYDKEQDLIEK